MSVLLAPLRWLYCIYSYTLFVIIMLLVFPFALVATLFGRVRGGNMVMWLCRVWADVWLGLSAIRFRFIFEAPHDKKRPYIFVSNHISYLDAAIIPKAYRQPIRPLAKSEMARLPIFGLIYRYAIVAVNRSSPEHRAESVRILKSLIRKGISVLVFPEGTFNTTSAPLKSFYDGAFRVAIETQTPLKPVLVLDSYARMHYRSVFSLNPGRCRIVYLGEIPVEGLTAEDIPALREKVFALMSERLRAYKADWIATEPAV